MFFKEVKKVAGMENSKSTLSIEKGAAKSRDRVKDASPKGGFLQHSLNLSYFKEKA